MHATAIEPGMYALRAGRWSLLASVRPIAALATLMLVLALACAVAMCAGPVWHGPAQLAAVASGDATPAMRMLLVELRLPRLVAGLLAGCALGLAGALVQAACRNRLASPDVLGVADGATLGVFAGLIAAGTGLMGPWWSGPLGAAAALTLLLAGARNASVTALLITGIGLASVMRAITELLLSRQELMHASALYSWSVGSLAGRGYDAALPLLVALIVLAPPALMVARRLDLLRLGADLAMALGAPVKHLQWLALILAALLAGLAVGVCGPIAFVALAAPFVATRLAGGGRVAAACAAVTGALLVVCADTLGRVVVNGAELPAGVICNLLGGPFLLWLLLAGSDGESA